MEHQELYNSAITLLHNLIQIPSFSGEEEDTASLISDWLENHGITFHRQANNIWATNDHCDPSKPTILLNSHHDTVRPNKAYTNDPFQAIIDGNKLYGLGSNDAGGCLVSLLASFAFFYRKENLKYNLLIAATAEEENSGPNGISSLLPNLPIIDFAIVGEPTEMQLAIAEKGLLVIDGYAPGKAGHAAHSNTDNAIYNALDDINWIRNYQFPKVSEVLGAVRMSVTQINAGQQHNQVPASCHFVVDVRVNEHYSNEEIYQYLNAHTRSELKARSFRLNSSSIPEGHPIVKAGIALGHQTYGSPTLSDQALLSCPSLKMGPGVSARSHSANEFVLLSEIGEGIKGYIELLEKIIV